MGRPPRAALRGPAALLRGPPVGRRDPAGADRGRPRRPDAAVDERCGRHSRSPGTGQPDDPPRPPRMDAALLLARARAGRLGARTAVAVFVTAAGRAGGGGPGAGHGTA